MLAIIVTVFGCFLLVTLFSRLNKNGKGKVIQPLSSRKVYDVTPYVEEHPGGDAMLTNAGGDATEGFYRPQHDTRVFDMVDVFCIGNLKA